MGRQHIHVRNVAVIGAGVSGTAAAIRLKQRGLNVKLFERTDRIGGVWVFDERIPDEPSYPSTLPSYGFSGVADAKDLEEIAVSHAPPGPAYQGLKNNVSMIEMEMQTLPWDWDDEEFVQHSRLANYIERAAWKHELDQVVSFGTRVSKVFKDSDHWTVESVKLTRIDGKLVIHERKESFDAVVVASGHYHACNVPDIPGLVDWKQKYPDRVMHSKQYRHPDSFRGQNVLLVGAGVSSTDIAREIGPLARSVVQVSRGGQYDLSSAMLPPNGSRVGAIRSFDTLRRDSMETLTSDKDEPIPGSITLESGEKFCDFHRVVMCTGYHVSYPFLRQFHADGCSSADADDAVIVTDGQQTHNLHKDIFYIPDPTLAFIGVPYHVATFSLFDFQAVALAAVFSGAASLPDELQRREEYRARLAEKGAGRNFHSLKGLNHEQEYVEELVALANEEGTNSEPMIGHSQRFHDAYARRLVRIKDIRGAVRPDSDERAARALLPSCR
ncbi:FAD/NAD(P)-binding domain-containing protein [Myriangium duriaei CBS 260.36]|uniref:FAD/NAD(P)-binding domain-containing protein n=1 Tax=Myriangium duriaei CBS 260.36 TaxID=1168546 RepID=A0A9P4J7S2_9PEZI|nr:FAD/NAD(P)-binding domain-containing protein [Myriangium duriaei CBS 260.36]